MTFIKKYEIIIENILNELGYQDEVVQILPSSKKELGDFQINTAMQLIAVIFQLQSLQQFGGVSATHIDHTMVPYVRKSFLKHFKSGLKYVGRYSEDKINKYLNKYGICDDTPIDNVAYRKHKNIYDFAMDSTERESY